MISQKTTASAAFMRKQQEKKEKKKGPPVFAFSSPADLRHGFVGGKLRVF